MAKSSKSTGGKKKITPGTANLGVMIFDENGDLQKTFVVDDDRRKEVTKENGPGFYHFFPVEEVTEDHPHVKDGE